MDNLYFPRRPVSLAEQVMVMKRHFPGFSVRWHKNIVRWVGELRPTDISQRYRIKIIHQLYRKPEVHVLKPLLVTDERGMIPHVYPGRRLCLFHPQKREWGQGMHVATTIVPWTALWLYYYEVWQATGDWLGGGEHPELRRSPRSPLQLVKRLHAYNR